MVKLVTGKYFDQLESWPSVGKHILAQFDEEGIIVYQAYNYSIGKFAIENQHFGGNFSYSRMSWIKPNFMWMMYRSGWGIKPNQMVVLAIRLRRTFFDEILEAAFPSKNDLCLSPADWKEGLAVSDVRLQWDPDHDPYGNPLHRRAIQLGLRRRMLEPLKGEGILSILDISDFVATQRRFVQYNMLENLETPIETIYPISEAAKNRLQMSC